MIYSYSFLFYYNNLKLQGGAFIADDEGGMAAYGQGEVAQMAVSYGKVIAYRDVVTLQVFVEHVVHILETAIGMLVVGKLADNDAANM